MSRTTVTHLVAAIAVVALAAPATAAAQRDQGYVDQRNPDSRDVGRAQAGPAPGARDAS